MPIADEDRTAAGALEANYHKIVDCIKDAANINRKLLREMSRMREENARLRHRIEVLETANREMRAWRNVAEKIKEALGREEIDNAEPVSADRPISPD